MADRDSYDPRRELLQALLEKADADHYPSSTMLDVIESLLATEDVPAYSELLLRHIREDMFPSVDMINRAAGLA